MSAIELPPAACDTFPKLLEHHRKVRPGRPAFREKDFGIWQTHNWAQVAEEVRALAAGLFNLGVQRGDKVAIVGDNRPRLYWTMTAVQAIGAVPVPLYQDSVADEMAFVLEHAEARFAVVEDQEQVDKLLEVKGRCPILEQIVYDESRGLRHYTQPFLHHFDAVQAEGRDYNKVHPDFYDDFIAKGKGDDPAVILYTSGTTGKPKGVILSFDNVVKTAANGVKLENLTDREESVAYLPMAWVGDHIFSYGQSYVAGFCVACPESSATVMQDLRELGPTYFFAPPRIFENILTTVMIRMEDAGWLKRRMFRFFMDVARRCGTRILDGKAVAFGDHLLYALGRLLVYGPLINTLGFTRIRLAYTAGEAIGPDIFDFYRSLGVNLKQLYGSTEASVFITIQPDGEIAADTVGKPAIDVEIKIADSGEVLFRSPGVFVEYFKNPQATQETKTSDGWVHTGDAGFFDENGHLKIIDRAKDVGRLNNGGLFPPKYVENKLKFFPDIKEAVAFGHERDFCAVLVNIDLAAVGSWAERNNVAYGSYQELASNPRVIEIIKGHIDKVNRDLAADPQLASCQIRRFLVLHKELDADDGELTRTRKVRRSFVAERYQVLVNALYSGAASAHIETEVTFEDGRKGTLKADIDIIDVEIEPVEPALRKAS
jgi:long-chain acyl-CoA synthetase